MDPTFRRALRISGYALVVISPVYFAGSVWGVLHGYELAWLFVIFAVIGTVVGITYIRRAKGATQGEQTDASRAG